MDRTSLDDVRLVREMIQGHLEDLRKERIRLEALRREWTRVNAQAAMARDAGRAENAPSPAVDAEELRKQIVESEQKIARVEELVEILRRKQHAL